MGTFQIAHIFTPGLPQTAGNPAPSHLVIVCNSFVFSGSFERVFIRGEPERHSLSPVYPLACAATGIYRLPQNGDIKKLNKIKNLSFFVSSSGTAAHLFHRCGGGECDTRFPNQSQRGTHL